MNITTTYNGEGYWDPVINRWIWPRAEIILNLYDVPDELDRDMAIEWVRRQLATMCAILSACVAFRNIQNTLLRISADYRRSINDTVRSAYSEYNLLC